VPTLSDVAQRAGVTTATVSNVIRGKGSVGLATAERVRAIISELGYRPNLTARALAEGRSPTLALLVSSIANPFYPEFARAAEQAARREGHFLLVCHTDSDPDIGLAYLDRVSSGLSEGVLAMAGNLRPHDLAAVASRGVPVVLVMWEQSDERMPLHAVMVDFLAAGRLAAEHLLALGHREIGLVSGCTPDGMRAHAQRHRGFVATLADAGLSLPEQRIAFDTDTIDGGFRAATELLRREPGVTALFATNDLLAIGAMQAAAALGREVPRTLSVIGVTDIHLAAQMRPALTTVSIGTATIAEAAIGFLLDLIKHVPAAPKVCEGPPPVLIRRGSTSPPPH
jgi:DNA-binding LacI/PurR family transcriptional regulator